MTKPRVIPPDDRGYPGLTAIPLGKGRELVCMGTGKEVEKLLRERVKR